jgi:hypothetical protein
VYLLIYHFRYWNEPLSGEANMRGRANRVDTSAILKHLQHDNWVWQARTMNVSHYLAKSRER